MEKDLKKCEPCCMSNFAVKTHRKEFGTHLEVSTNTFVFFTNVNTWSETVHSKITNRNRK